MGLAIIETFKTLEEAELMKDKYSLEDGWDKNRLFIYNDSGVEGEPYCLCVD